MICWKFYEIASCISLEHTHRIILQIESQNMEEYFDEEGLLKVIKTFELSEEITRLNWNWNNHSDSVKEAHELMGKGQKLFLEISEYEERIGSKLSEYQKNKIEDAIVDLGKLISYMKNKIKPYESLEKTIDLEKKLLNH